MVGSYEVCLGNRSVGTVVVRKEGLYYRISCLCTVTGDTMYRLRLRRGGKETDLGLCVPTGASFGTEKRIPMKQCGEGTPEFFLCPQGADARGTFVPLCPEEPFRYIHRLQDAFLERRGDRLGIVIR